MSDTTFQIRPRFKLELPYSAADVQQMIEKRLAVDESVSKGRFTHGHGTIRVPVASRHYWSPELNFSIEELGDGCVLRGLYGPRPQVWTLFVLFYSFTGFLILITLFYGLSYVALGQPAPIIIWAVPVLLLVFMSLYLVSFLGQRFGKKQIIVLHIFMEECLEELSGKHSATIGPKVNFS